MDRTRRRAVTKGRGSDAALMKFHVDSMLELKALKTTALIVDRCTLSLRFYCLVILIPEP
jgi:hypothetical protein